MKTQAEIKKGDRVQRLVGRTRPTGKVLNTAWGDVYDRKGTKTGRMLWVRVRWDDRVYGDLNPNDSVTADDVRLLPKGR